MTARPSYPELRRGRRLGEFVLGDQIGRGGFADVFHASQPSLGRAAVIKILRGATSARQVRQFEREARMACQLDHPYAAHVYAFGVEPDGLMWIAMELVRGISLAEWIDAKGPIPLGRFIGLFERLCEVVHSAHQAGLVHRDIKPSNVMVVTRSGKLMPKLLDFGIAMASDASASADRPPAAVAQLPLGEVRGDDESTDPTPTADRLHASGTPAYMAPEQWHGGAHDHRVDIYALGVVAYRSLTGRAPFTGKTARELLLAHQRQPVPRLGEGFSLALDGVIGRALAKDPSDRFATALELGDALQRAATGADEWIDLEEARRWLRTAPPQLAASIAAIVNARDLADACEATHRWLTAVAQWLGVIALAGVATLGHSTDPAIVALAKLRSDPLTTRDWLELAAALCAPYTARDEDFPVPELVAWFVDESLPSTARKFDDGERRPDALLAALAVVRGAPTAYPRDVVGRVLRGLAFIPGYTVLVGGDEWTTRNRVRAGEPVWLSDGDRNPLVELSPLVAAAPPSPNEPVELFAVIGGGRGAARQIAYPEGFEREAPELWPWLDARFASGAADRGITIADRAPYRGLAPFGVDDAELFFGRERVVDQLFNRMLGHPFVALTGPSGSGKSSLVHAGLLPRLPENWIAIAMRPGRDPVAALDGALVDGGLPGLGHALPTLIGWLRDHRRRLLLVIDQAEELLTLADPEQRSYLASILAYLVGAAGDRIRVVITLRHDFIGRADEIPEWRELIQHNLQLVTVPSRDELTAMVTGPAAHVGFGFDDPDLVTDMVAEVADRPGALPLLSFAAARLWEARDPAHFVMTRAAYQAMGGVGGALARYAEDVYAALTPRQQTLARDLLRRLITADGTSAPARRDELITIDEGAAAVLDHLVTARLVVASERGDGHHDVALAHEALIERWPRLIQWRRDDAEGARHRDELRAAAALWELHRRAASYLWRGEALALYRTWAPRWAGALTASELAFGKASGRAAARARRARRIVVATALAGLSAALIVVVGLYQRADRNRDDAEQRFTDMLVDRGRSELLAERPLRALIYYAAAYQRGRDNTAMRYALGQTVRAMERERSRARLDGEPNRIRRDGDIMTTIARNGPARSWRVDNGKLIPIATYAHDGDYAREAVGVSPTGRTAARGGQGPLRIWDRDGKLLAKVDGEAGINHIALTDDLIVTDWGTHRAINLWDRAGRPLATLGDPRSPRISMVSLQLSEDGKLLVACYDDGVVEVWAPHERRMVWRREIGPHPVGAVMVTDRVLAHNRDGEVFGWTLAGEQVFRIQAHKTIFALSANPTEFVTAGAETTVKVWSMVDGKQLAALEHSTTVLFVMLSPDNRKLLSYGGENVVSLWDLEHRLRIGQIDLGTEIMAATFAPDGSVVTLDGSGAAQLWDAEPDALAAAFLDHRDDVFSVAIAPDGETVATSGADRFVRVWQLDTGAARAALPTDSRILGAPFRQGLGFLPDGRLIAPSYFGAAVWDVNRQLRIGDIPEHSALQSIATDRRGHVATSNSSGSENHVQLWDEASQRRIAYLPRKRIAHHISLSPEGDRVAIADGSDLSVWDVARDQVWSEPAGGGYAVAFSADGTLVSSGSDDGFVRVRDAVTGRLVREIKQPGRAMCVAFSPDGALIASASSNSKIYLWEIATGELATVFIGHDNMVSDLAFARDGTRLVSTSRDARALVWRLRSEPRPPAVLANEVAARLPFRLEGAELVVNEHKRP